MKISAETLVPASFIVFVGSICLWVGALDARAKNTADDLTIVRSDINLDQKTYNDTILKIDRRLSRIEGALNIDDERQFRRRN